MFSKVLKELRTEKEITQSKMASDFNMSRNTIASWEAKKREPPIETLIQIATYFDVSLDYLCGRTSDASLPTVEYQRGAELTPKERKLLNDFRQLPEDFQTVSLMYLETARKRHGIQKEQT